MKIKLFSFLLVVFLLAPFVVAAQSNPCSGASGNLGQCISQVYVWSLGISGLLAVAMTVFGGYLVMSARGDGSQVAKGKSFITSSLIGMALLFAAYIILNTINTDLTEFSNPVVPATQSGPGAGTGAGTNGAGAGGSGTGTGSNSSGTGAGSGTGTGTGTGAGSGTGSGTNETNYNTSPRGD